MPGTPPTPSPRVEPTGFKLPDGYRSTFTFSLKPTVALWEMTVQPTGEDGGEAIDTTTMWNESRRTYHPKALVKNTEVKGTAAYDPDAIPDIRSMTNKPQVLTEHLPDGSSDCFYGWLQKVDFKELKEGEFPQLDYTVFVSNTDPDGNEQGPVYTPASGT